MSWETQKEIEELKSKAVMKAKKESPVEVKDVEFSLVAALKAKYM